MGRCRFVAPGTVKIPLATVYQSALDALRKRTKPKKATKAELDAAQADLDEATEDGAWIEVKRELNAGEQRRVFGNMVREGFIPGQRTVLDPEKVGITKVVEYLVGWSFCDESGEMVEISEDAINNLDPDTYREIVAAVDAHEERVEAERTARKNGRAGAKGSKATLTSPSAPAGLSNTSAH